MITLLKLYVRRELYKKKAIESLIRDAALWKKKRDRAVRATRLTQFSLNKHFLKNLLTRNESFNDRLKTSTESKLKLSKKNVFSSDNEASTSKDANKKNTQETSHAESEESFRIVGKKHRKRRRRRSSSESSTDHTSTSSSSDSSIEVIIAKKRKQRKKGKSSKHYRKRRSSSSSSSYENIRKHIKKSISSKYLKFPSHSKSKKLIRQLEQSPNTHNTVDSEVRLKENNGNKEKTLTDHQNISAVSIPREPTENEKTKCNRHIFESQSKESVQESPSRITIATEKGTSTRKSRDITDDDDKMVCAAISCKQLDSVNNDEARKETAKIFESQSKESVQESPSRITIATEKETSTRQSRNITDDDDKMVCAAISCKQLDPVNNDEAREETAKIFESQSKESVQESPSRITIATEKETSTRQSRDITDDDDKMVCAAISCKQLDSVNNDEAREETVKIETIQHTMIILEDTKNPSDIPKKCNKNTEKSETEMCKKKSQSKEFTDKFNSGNKKRKSRRKSSHKKLGTNKERNNKLLELLETEKEKMSPKKANLYSDEDIFLKIVPITENEKILNKRLKDNFSKTSNEQDASGSKTSHSHDKNEKEKENNCLGNEDKTNRVNLQTEFSVNYKKHKYVYDEEKDNTKNNSDIVEETPLGKINRHQKESVILNKIDEPVDASELLASKVSFSLSTKQIKTLKKPTEFQHEVESSDRTASPVERSKKSKKKKTGVKATGRSSSAKKNSPKVDLQKRKSRSRSIRSRSDRDNSSCSISKGRNISRSMSRYSTRNSRTPSSDSYSYSRSSRSKYRSYTRSRSGSRYRRYSRSSRETRSYSTDSRKKYRSSIHSSYSSRNRHSSRSSYRDSRSSSRHRSRKYRDRSSSSRSRRRRSISFSYVYTNPEKARKYYREKSYLSTTSSSSGHNYRRYKGK